MVNMAQRPTSLSPEHKLCIDDNVQDQDDVGNDIVVWGGLTVNVEF